MLKNEGEVAQAVNGMMFLRIGEQIFKLDLEERKTLNFPGATAKDFMKALPHSYTEEDVRT